MSDETQPGTDEFPEIRLIRPSAVLPEAVAAQILRALEDDDVRHNGLWLTTPTVWQRYDRPFSSATGDVDALLMGTISVVYDSPRRREITIYRVSLTEVGKDQGWTIETLCNEPLGHAGLTLDSCPRADLTPPPAPDPFRARAGQVNPDAPEGRSPFDF